MEYKIICLFTFSSENESILNQFAKEGWHLVAVEQTTHHLDSTTISYASVSYKSLFYLERKLKGE